MIGPARRTDAAGRQAAALVAAARRARRRAYAPYSQYPVGAAVLAADGTVFAGANIENASYGLSICAERVAIFTAAAAGRRRLRAVAVVTGSPEPAAPCGACRQVMVEFGVQTVYLAGPRGPFREWRLPDLLPEAFSAEALLPKPSR
ncbi:MAG: cytidine deaminase [Armatimonadota bacterium]|nr:cytidine deaminase [Armatimonadota bacterium]